MSKVLLVEDDNNLREIYEARLAAEGYEIITAQNGEEALVVAKQHHPDLIISDVMMPRISGFEMLDILRNTDELRDTKVIMLTALGQAEDQARAGKLGADRYLVKSQVTLEDIVNNAKALLSELPTTETTPTPIAAPIQAPEAQIATEPSAPAPALPQPEPEQAPSPTPGPDNAVPQAVPVLDSMSAPAIVITPGNGVSVADPDPIAQPFNPVADVAQSVNVDESVKVITTEAATAQSTAAEEAAVETQIENFANATKSVAPQSEETVAPAAEELAPVSVSAANDKILAEAVDDLTEASGAPAAVVVAPSEKVVPGEEASTTQPSPVPVSVPVEPAEPVAEKEIGNDLQPIAGKKVISPISGSITSPNLEELLAKEEQKEQLGTTGQAVEVPVVKGAAPVASAPAPANPAFDPSSISL